MTKNKASHSPALSTKSSGTTSHELWLRIQAFLALRSKNTRETYIGVLQEFCRFLGTNFATQEAANRMLKLSDLHVAAYRSWLEGRPGEVPRMLRGYRAAQNQKGQSTKALSKLNQTQKSRSDKSGLEFSLSNATISKKITIMRRIYRMLIDADLGPKKNPFSSDKLTLPPKDSGRKRPTEMLDFNVVSKIISTPDTSTPKGLRDQAILALLFGAGLRRSEVAKLRIADVKRSRQGTMFLYLRSTKGKKDAEQAIPDWAANCIDTLIKERLSNNAHQSEFLFICYTGQAGQTPTLQGISESGIYKLFKSYCKQAGAGDFVTPHSARATAITKLLHDGISHRNVQQFSRHASVQMVELYDKRRLGVEDNPGKGLKF